MTAHPKPPATADRAARKRAQQALDRRESAEVRKRSIGRCEAVEVITPGIVMRCCGTAVHVHHMIGGRGRRGIGASALAIHKQHICDFCHTNIEGGIGGKRLILIQRLELPLWDDVYRRIR